MVEQRVNESSRLWDAIGEEREAADLHERNMGSLYAAAWGLRVRRSTHLAYAIDISERVATNDLQRLVEQGFVEPVGERRGRYYIGTDRLRRLRDSTREPRVPISDPFA
jgi:Fic family protein